MRLCSGHPKVHCGTIVEGSWEGCTVGPPGSLTIPFFYFILFIYFVCLSVCLFGWFFYEIARLEISPSDTGCMRLRGSSLKQVSTANQILSQSINR